MALILGQHAPANRVAAQIAGGVVRSSRSLGTRERRVVLSTVVVKVATSGNVEDWCVCESTATAFVRAVHMRPLDGGHVRVFVLMWGDAQLQWSEMKVDGESLSALFRSLVSPRTGRAKVNLKELRVGHTQAVVAYMERAYRAYANFPTMHDNDSN